MRFVVRTILVVAVLAAALVVFTRWRHQARSVPKPPVQPPLASLPASGAALVPRAGTDPAEFKRGQQLFEHAFGVPEGLGPFFNDVSCVACHSIPMVGGQGDFGHRVVQDDARPKHTPQGETKYAADEPAHVPPSLLGIGVVDALSDDDIASGCGTDARLGIHGVPSRVENGNGVHVNRFGRTLRTRDIRAFVARALNVEQGITNHGTPDEPKTCSNDASSPRACGPGDAVELDDASVRSIATFVGGLAPIARLPTDGVGEALFTRVGCGVCHRIDAKYQLGSDVCLHDLGALRERNSPPQPAPNDYVRKWATARLSGIRFRPTMLHDGRATTIHDAVMAHDGEAAAVVDAYVELSESERQTLVDFVFSL